MIPHVSLERTSDSLYGLLSTPTIDDNVEAANLSAVELSFAVLCACVPMYLPLIKFCTLRLKKGSGSSRSGESYRELAERSSTRVWSDSAGDRPVHTGIHVTRTIENQV